jgi:hypothetical protein
MNKTMKTVAIDRFGGLNEMKIRELRVPELDANKILVRVEAAGVGVWDPAYRNDRLERCWTGLSIRAMSRRAWLKDGVQTPPVWTRSGR